MNKQYPKISVITPSFNQGKYIRETIESVRSQNYPNYEHIVIDGGSTDNTTQILKEYRDIKWVSEKDRGQSDALNKALGMVSGDVIAWINSDDCYLPGAFHSAIEALEDYPIVMGDCHVTNEVGKVDYTVENIPRSWFDLLKYWIPYSIPTQPAIFFRRDLITQNERNPGELFDVNLNYTMDYDLWMRIAIKNPLVRRIKQPFATYRMTEDNKTGPQSGGLAHAEPEMSLIFHRAETIALAPSYRWSVIIPFDRVDKSLEDTIRSVIEQQGADLEIILTPIGDNSELKSSSKALMREINTNQRTKLDDRYLRLNTTTHRGLFEAIQASISMAEGRYIQVLRAGDLISDSYLTQLQSKFQNNRVGFILPFRSSHSLAQSFAPSDWKQTSQALEVRLEAILETNFVPTFFAARRVALLECADLSDLPHPQCNLRRMILEGLNRGWYISAPEGLPLSLKSSSTMEGPADAQQIGMVAAYSLIKSNSSLSADPFQIVRIAHGVGFHLPDEILNNCKALLDKGGQLWKVD